MSKLWLLSENGTIFSLNIEYFCRQLWMYLFTY